METMRIIKRFTLTLSIWGAFGVLIGSADLKRDAEREYHEHIQRVYTIEMDAFIEALGQRESSGRYDIVNHIGAMGKWQFTASTLKMLGFSNITPLRFKHDPDIFPPVMQQEAIMALLQYNEVILHDFIQHYQGMVINNVLITKGGLLAGAHLGGAGAVKAWLLSYGKVDRSDGHTYVSDYIQEFSGFALEKVQ